MSHEQSKSGSCCFLSSVQIGPMGNSMCSLAITAKLRVKTEGRGFTFSLPFPKNKNGDDFPHFNQVLESPPYFNS
ncbi:hypothetical protein OLMES_2958 [Oleiphilus messinensis]|uniref:Uncharacterized protein n=1 Tax=Oleiphilus messinensis TaxID=141451 RepID=A0A1Y0I914_9GAMM|nr:hypothetical protein OLMES_2958 [Oleiphilus messinensis]